VDIHHLVMMANDIEAYFAAYPDREEAVAGITNHIRSFWDPRMRRELVAYAATGGSELKPLVREAVLMLSADAKTSAKPRA
jgi:formate dehydrogenase subunit delta